jgi:hypothetical protein
MLNEHSVIVWSGNGLYTKSINEVVVSPSRRGEGINSLVITAKSFFKFFYFFVSQIICCIYIVYFFNCKIWFFHRILPLKLLFCVTFAALKFAVL